MPQKFIERKLTALNEIAKDTRNSLAQQQQEMLKMVSTDLKHESNRLQHIKTFFGAMILLSFIATLILTILCISAWKLSTDETLSIISGGVLSVSLEINVYLIAVKSNEMRIDRLETIRQMINQNIEKSIENIGRSLSQEQQVLMKALTGLGKRKK